MAPGALEGSGILIGLEVGMNQLDETVDIFNSDLQPGM